MRSLKAMLAELEGGGRRLELMSGRRPRVEGGGALRHVADDIVTDADVLALCKVAGAGRRLDELAEHPISWTYLSDAGPVRITAQMRGREVAATFELSSGEPQRGTPQPAAPAARPIREAPRGAEVGRRDARRDSMYIEPVRPPAQRIEVTRAPAAEPPRTIPDRGAPERAPKDAARQEARRHEPAREAVTQKSMRPPKRSRADMRALSGDAPPRRSSGSDTPRAREVDARPPASTHAATTPDAPAAPRRTSSAPDRAAVKASPPAEHGHPAPPRGLDDAIGARPAPAGPAPSPPPAAPPPPAPAPAAAPPAPAAAKLAATSPAAPTDAHAGGAPQPRRRLEPQLLELLGLATRRGASDLHLTSGRPARARIDGRLTDLGIGGTMNDDRLTAMLASILPPRLEAAFQRDGGADFAVELPSDGRARASATRTLAGMRLAFRLLPEKPLSVPQLGLPMELAAALEHHQGLIVITGPTGHGKTTTLAALVDHVNEHRQSHVITIEDPIEIVHGAKKAVVSQREVGVHAKSFARALEGALRQDPDVVVVGELRDVETVRMALAASETGHLVLVTMNTPSAPRAIEFLIDLFPAEEQPQVRITLASALRLVACQRLVPGREAGKRHVAVELLPGGMSLGSIIRDGKTYQLPALMQRGRGAGIVRLSDALADLVKADKVDVSAALAFVDDKTELKQLLAEGAAPVAPAAPAAAPAAPGPKLGALTDLDDGPLRGLWNKAGAIFGKKGDE